MNVCYSEPRRLVPFTFRSRHLLGQQAPGRTPPSYVCKNPANAGHSRFGVESIDDWLQLDRYLLNGQEYLQLTSGVRDALENLNHFPPRYANRDAELAGLIWFQGDADGDWPSKAAAYEQHLANLIRDLRKELSSNFSGTGALVIVPEPSSIALLGLGGLALIFYRRRC